MTLTSFTSGINTTFSTELNQNSAEVLSLIGKEHIRTLIDRAGVYSADSSDGWGEAYLANDSDGRNGSVDETSTTTARKDEDYDYFVPGINDLSNSGTNHDPDSFTNYANGFDGDLSTYAEKTGTGGNTYEIGKTFSATTITRVFVKGYYNNSDMGEAGSGVTVKLQSYNGTSWSDEVTFVSETPGGVSSGTFREIIDVDSSVQGLRVLFTITPDDAGDAVTARLYALEYETEQGTSRTVISHTIPSGTFSSTISTAVATALVENWETGVTIDYKLKNSGGDDTGWLNTNEISEFTAFTAEPDELQIGLTPKSGGTNNYPAIKGCWVRAS